MNLCVEVWSRNFSTLWTYEILLYACLVNKGIEDGFELKFNDFCKKECLSGILVKQAFKLARRAFIAGNIGLLAKQASSWFSERT
jgi:hypothetical protein